MKKVCHVKWMSECIGELKTLKAPNGVECFHLCEGHYQAFLEYAGEYFAERMGEGKQVLH